MFDLYLQYFSLRVIALSKLLIIPVLLMMILSKRLESKYK